MNEIRFSTILRDVSESLRRMIKAAIPDVEVLLASPSEMEKGPDRRVAVYLYRVSENPYLRNLPPVVTPTVRPVRVDALYLDLHYLIVPYATPEAELVLANQLAVLFREVPVLREPEATRTSEPLLEEWQIRIVPIYLPVEEVHRIWGLFPSTPYRLSLFYTLTPVRIPLLPVPAPHRVVELEVGYHVRQPGAAADEVADG